MKKEQLIELLSLLERDGRQSHERLATLMNVTVQEIDEAVAYLEEEQIILSYPALINWDKIQGDDQVTAMIEVKVIPQRNRGFDEIAERIYHFPEVTAVYLMSGAFDLSVTIEGKSMKEVATFVSQKLSTLDTVMSTATHFILKRYKHDGVIYEEDNGDKRMVVSP